MLTVKVCFLFDRNWKKKTQKKRNLKLIAQIDYIKIQIEYNILKIQIKTDQKINNNDKKRKENAVLSPNIR